MVFKRPSEKCHLLAWVLYLCPLVTEGGNCSSAWWGRNCEYRCLCKNQECGEWGECQEESKCETNKFGPACQFVNLATPENPQQPHWLLDSDDSTCNVDQAIDQEIKIQVKVTFTWARIVVHNPDLLYRINLEFSNNRTCKDMETHQVSATSLDIVCHNFEIVYDVILKGKGIAALCSLYISGGRNVALKQKTKQSSLYRNSTSMKAVDGDTNQIHKDDNCAHTAPEDMTPVWKVTFIGHSYFVTRIVIYSRKDNDMQRRIQGFIITMYNEEKQILWTHIDQKVEAKDTFVLIIAEKRPVKEITLKLNNSIINLCEFEVYGDPECPSGTSGFQCENYCTCDNSECFVNTGGCLSKCKNGHTFLLCPPDCDQGRYGIHCSHECHRCMNNMCERESGECVYGCAQGFYKPACMSACSSHCTNKTCHHDTGECTDGCNEGYVGPTCEIEAVTDSIVVWVSIIWVGITILICILFCLKSRSNDQNDQPEE